MKKPKVDMEEITKRYEVLAACIAGASATLAEVAAPGDYNDRIKCGLEAAHMDFADSMSNLFKNGGTT